MESLDASYQAEGNNDSRVEAYDAETLSLDIKDISDVISVSRDTLQNEVSALPSGDIAAQDEALLSISASDVSYSFVDTLQHNGIDSLEIDASALSDPRSALQTVFETGDASLREKGIPAPDVEFYNTAMETAQTSGQDFHDVIADMGAEQPLMMRHDLLPRDSIDLVDASDTVYAAPDIEGPVAETQYDVHVMGFPIVTTSIRGVNFDSSASHGFITVTERGADPMVRENILLASRGGPDHRAGQTMMSPDSTLPEDTPSETEKTDSGNVFIEDFEKSMEMDYDHDRMFYVDTIETGYDFETIKSLVDSHARHINFADIDYELLNRNSNTYYGDITEILTGQEPPDFSFSGGLPRYFPAINNDLTDYSKTEFAQSFGYEPHRDTTTDQTQESLHINEEDYSYGLD